ncbi:UNVERIFIED_CONTAM: hypothetical protein FKN15_060782 [Acipenser sinensis]
MNTRCPPKRVPSAARFFTLCRLTVQPPQSYSVGEQRSSGQLTGKPAGARPDHRGRWCAIREHLSKNFPMDGVNLRWRKQDGEIFHKEEEEEEEEEKEKYFEP